MGGPANSIFFLLGLLASLCFPIGLMLFFLGWRGKRSGNFPSCGSCRFDVSGLPIDASSKCPECGAALLGNAKKGLRKKRIALLIVGVVFLGFSGSFAALLLFRGGWVNRNATKPTFLLKADIAIGGRFQDAALSEFKIRIGSGQLSRSSTNDLVQQALALQADKSRTWVPGFGEVLETARSMGMVSDSDWLQFVCAAAGFKIEGTTTITQGDQIAVRVTQETNQLSENIGLVARFSIPEVQVDGISQKSWLGHWTSSISGSRSSFSITSPIYLDSIQPGTHELQLIFKVELQENAVQSTSIRKTLAFTVLPAGRESHSLRSDSALVEQVIQGTTLEMLTITETKHGRAKVDLRVRFSKIPIATAFDVFLKLKEPLNGVRELKIGSASAPINTKSGPHASHSGGTEIRIDHDSLARLSAVGEVELELRPSLEVAKRSVNMYEIWGTPITVQSKVTIILAKPSPQ